MLRRVALAVVAGTVAGLTLAEGALRAAGFHGITPPSNIVYDSELGWTLVPNRHEWQSAIDYGVWATTDADGLRIPDNDPPPDPHTPAILVLGDSYAYGYGVSGDQMFAAALQRALGGTTAYRVRTAGVPGYSTDQEYLRWKRLARVVRPRRVILLFHQSDLVDNTHLSVVMGPERFFKPRFAVKSGGLELEGVPIPDKERLVPAGSSEPVKAWFRPLATYALIQAGLRRAAASGTPPAGGAGAAPPAVEAYGVTAVLIRELHREVRAAGADLVVALVPATIAGLPQRLADICRAEEIPFVDLAPAFAGARDVRLPYDGHWNARGHAIAARAMAAAISARAGTERATDR